MGITHPAENVLLDPQGPESREKKTLINIKGHTKILTYYSDYTPQIYNLALKGIYIYIYIYIYIAVCIIVCY